MLEGLGSFQVGGQTAWPWEGITFTQGLEARYPTPPPLPFGCSTGLFLGCILNQLVGSGPKSA